MATLPDPLEIIDTPELRQDCISNIKLKLYDSLFKLKYYHFIFELVESHNYVCVKPVRELEGGPGGHGPQYLAIPCLESSEKATNLANTLPRSLDFKMRLVDKSSKQGLKAKSRGEAKQSKF